MSVDIEFAGYRPGALAAIVQLHMNYYHEHWQFGLHFETKIASELAEFLSRMDNQSDLIVTAYKSGGEQLIGSIIIDAVHADSKGAHLRWFIVDPQLAGQGLGRQLIDLAIQHCDNKAFAQVYLTTFRGLDAARSLYESLGFRLDDESNVDQWQGGVVEQRFIRKLPE